MGRLESEHEDDGFGEASRYTAHLDRGWSLLDRGDLQRARGSAHQALKLRPDIPDAAMLMAAISMADADPESSLEWYERAIEADADYVDAQLAAAQVLLYDLEQPERAIMRATTGRELDEATVADLIDFSLIEVEALVALGDRKSAATRMQEQPELWVLEDLLDRDTEPKQFADLIAAFIGDPADYEPDDVDHIMGRVISLSVRTARAWLDIGAPDQALPWLEGLLRRFGDDADIWYLCNEAAYLAGQAVRAAHAALTVLQLDARTALPAHTPEPSQLHAKVVELLLHCRDADLRALAREPNFVVIVQDAPPVELVLEGVDPRARALVLAARSSREGEPPLTLTGIAVYRRNLVRYARDQAMVERELAYAVFDELAVFFGFDDHRRELLGLPPSEWSGDGATKAYSRALEGSTNVSPNAATEMSETESAAPRKAKRKRQSKPAKTKTPSKPKLDGKAAKPSAAKKPSKAIKGKGKKAAKVVDVAPGAVVDGTGEADGEPKRGDDPVED